MKLDTLKTYLQLHQKLLTEKAQIERRLREINSVLKEPSAPSPVSARAAKTPGVRNQISLPQAVVQVTSRTPMTKEQILSAVAALGYRFQAREPIKSLNPVLYGKNPKFMRLDGKFSPAAGTAKKLAPGRPATSARKTKRTLSPAVRAKLAAIAKARWAKVKASGRKLL